MEKEEHHIKLEKTLLTLKKDILLGVAIMIALALLANTLILRKYIGELKLTSSSSTKAPDTIKNGEFVYGNEKADYVLVEYSDTECPYCKVFHNTVKNIVDNSNGKIAWVYRHYPLSFHPKAPKQAEAIECAGEIGGKEKFFAYIDKIFEVTPSNNGLEESELPNIAEAIGLDRNKFNECLSSGKMKAKVDSDTKDGRKYKVEGTPYTFITKKNGDNLETLETLNGAIPEESVKELLDILITE
jgi:protein-disulfide isomerase